MELWTEYEGRTIDGVFPLTKLLQPEGRSAFFSTPNGSGSPTVIRLIESHFDDDLILARWRGTEALNHPNLMTMKKFGKVEMDGAPLAYVVMEPATGNLGEIVAARRLTVEETREVAESLVAALSVLHENGFVHEHVVPGSVLAVGDVIKLRSDCIREAPEGAEGIAAKRRDVRDLATVLLRSLTQRRTLEEAKGELPLAAPFDGIVRNGLNGSWGLAEISAALAPAASPQIAAKAAAPVDEMATATDPFRVEKRPAKRAEESDFAAAPARTQRFTADEDEPSGAGRGLKVLLGLSVLVLALIAWRIFHRAPVEQKLAAAPVAAAQADLPVANPTTPAPVEQKPSAIVGHNGAVKTSSAVGAASLGSGLLQGRVEWRAIAFTYNHEDQAKTRAERLAQRHPELKPEVFTPNGRAPYLVSIGGPMSREGAYALARKARADDVARDVYAQNFKVTAEH